MARRRFFVDSICNQRAKISGEEARHLSQVLRVEAGQKYEISDNQNAWLAEVESARKDLITFRTLERVALTEPLVHIHLYIALIKFDHLELVLEKATELGVERITPVETIRSERGLEKAAGKRIIRWRRIALEASQQSRRDRLPVVDEPVRYRDALDDTALRRFVLDEDRSGMPLLEAVSLRALGDQIALLIGPEGGWVEEERRAAEEIGWRKVTIGQQILRAETAAISALAILQAAYATL